MLMEKTLSSFSCYHLCSKWKTTPVWEQWRQSQWANDIIYTCSTHSNGWTGLKRNKSVIIWLNNRGRQSQVDTRALHKWGLRGRLPHWDTADHRWRWGYQAGNKSKSSLTCTMGTWKWSMAGVARWSISLCSFNFHSHSNFCTACSDSASWWWRISKDSCKQIKTVRGSPARVSLHTRMFQSHFHVIPGKQGLNSICKHSLVR